ncbi:hypothetical protein BpHYR1_049438 [Brachionus plicatilis]|uniref:Uncharacterized protein n=1 Tax=Brachionus plicatilis TaxID=10195 RepID=A0A3M7P1X7_BRAPC|nr:hypothetical protein BpHYR1_049438 [Brachionus plicatilis]
MSNQEKEKTELVSNAASPVKETHLGIKTVLLNVTKKVTGLFQILPEWLEERDLSLFQQNLPGSTTDLSQSQQRQNQQKRQPEAYLSAACELADMAYSKLRTQAEVLGKSGMKAVFVCESEGWAVLNAENSARVVGGN